jgi:hypothetical protein
MGGEKRGGGRPKDEPAGQIPRPARDTGPEVARYKAAADEFAQMFIEKTAGVKDFMSIFELEDMIKELSAKTHRVNMDLVARLVESFDESKIIRKKKDDYKRLGVSLKTQKRSERAVSTLGGPLRLRRYILRPADDKSAQRLLDTSGKRTVIPMDELLGLGDWPYRVTPSVMASVAYRATIPDSERGSGFMEDLSEVHEATAKSIAAYVGRLVFETDLARDKNAAAAHYGFETVGPGRALYVAVETAPVRANLAGERGAKSGLVSLGSVLAGPPLAAGRGRPPGAAPLGPAGSSQADSGPADFGPADFGQPFGPATILETIACVEPRDLRSLLAVSAARHGRGPEQKIILLSDGGAFARTVASELGPEVKTVLSFDVLAAKTGALALAIFGGESDRARRWTADRLTELLAGRLEACLRAARLAAPAGEEAADFESFIGANADIMDYKGCAKGKIMISANNANYAIKNLVSRRFNKSYSAWKPDTAQSILTLMGKRLSNLWFSDVIKPIMTMFGREI